jgi:hypothetical protein
VGQDDLGGVDLVAVPRLGVGEPAIGGLGPLPRLWPDQSLPFHDLMDGGPGRHPPTASGPVVEFGDLLQVVANIVGPAVLAGLFLKFSPQLQNFGLDLPAGSGDQAETSAGSTTVPIGLVPRSVSYAGRRCCVTHYSPHTSL